MENMCLCVILYHVFNRKLSKLSSYISSLFSIHNSVYKSPTLNSVSSVPLYICVCVSIYHSDLYKNNWEQIKTNVLFCAQFFLSPRTISFSLTENCMDYKFSLKWWLQVILHRYISSFPCKSCKLLLPVFTNNLILTQSEPNWPKVSHTDLKWAKLTQNKPNWPKVSQDQ